jgi:hypothetical protein
MTIRTYQPGDEVAQVSIYNEAAGGLPKFKPATLDEVRRRFLALEFDPSAHFYAVEEGQPVGYAQFQANGRVSFPWCRKGKENHAEPLLQSVLQALRQRGLTAAFAAYRPDWPMVREFLLSQRFQQVREMVNFVMDLAEMPTPAARKMSSVTPLQSSDVPEILALAPEALRIQSVEAMERHLLHNDYFSAKDVFVLRGRTDSRPVAVGVVVENPAYADYRNVDPNMPCFRLGAFGTEGMQVKRINGLFSFVARPDRELNRLGLELLGHAAARLDESEGATLVAQVATDVPFLHRFYQQYFRKQGSFPIFERNL